MKYTGWRRSDFNVQGEVDQQLGHARIRHAREHALQAGHGLLLHLSVGRAQLTAVLSVANTVTGQLGRRTIDRA